MSNVPYKYTYLKSKNWCNYSYYFPIFSSMYIICTTVRQQRTEISNFLKKAVEKFAVYLLLKASDCNLISKLHHIQLFLYGIKCFISSLCMLFITSILSLHCGLQRKINWLNWWQLLATIPHELWYAKDCTQPTHILSIFLGIAAVSIQSTTVIVHRVFLMFFRPRGFYFAASKWDSSIG